MVDVKAALTVLDQNGAGNDQTQQFALRYQRGSGGETGGGGGGVSTGGECGGSKQDWGRLRGQVPVTAVVWLCRSV